MIHVCPNCFGDQGLKRRIKGIRPDFPNDKCSFHPRYKGVPIEEVSRIIDGVFRSHYGVSEYHFIDGEQEGDSLELVIGELTQSESDEITKAVVQQLIEDDDYWPGDGGEPFYMDDYNYIRYQSSYCHHSELWRNFCNSIVHDQRFFNSEAKLLIAEIFEGIHFQRNYQTQAPVYRIKAGDPAAIFYRARIANQEKKQKAIAADPAKELGPPPERSRRAGRMNSAGIARFYGAYNLDTCIAELRPVVGNTVIGAEFELARSIHVLDTTRFEAPIKSTSKFSKNHMMLMEQWTFMQSFMQQIAKPISPDDEHLDYIPTQAVAEYLLNHHRFKRDGKFTKIEGIIFSSAQYPEGRNIVLLGEAAQVKQPTIITKRKDKSSGFSDFFPDTFAPFLAGKEKPQNPGLRVDVRSVKTHRVISAKYGSIELGTFDLEAEDLEY